MATVLTRLLPTNSSRLLTRQLRRDVDVANNNSYKANSAAPVNPSLSEDVSDASGSVEEEAAVEEEEEVVGPPAEDSDYESAAEERAPESGSHRTSRTRKLRVAPHRQRRSRRIQREEESGDNEEEEEEDEQENNNSVTSDSSANTSTPDTGWEGESDAAEEIEVEVANPNRCVFCGQDEEHDPGEVFEEILNCSICGDNAHRQCARDEDALPSEDVEKWHCPSCIENGVQSDDVQSPDGETDLPERRRSSGPKMSRDLLAAGDPLKPGSHSVFRTLILEDDPLDGSRALRKRRISSESSGDPSRAPEPRKKPQQPTSAAEEVKTEDALVESKPESPNTPIEATPLDEPAQSRRTRTQRRSEKDLCRVVASDEDRFILAFMFGPSKLRELTHELKKKRRRERDRARRARQAEVGETATEIVVPHYPPVQATNVVTPFYAFNDRESDESKAKPYGGILSETEADTSRTFPQPSDRKKFEEARQRAEEEWKKKIEATAVNGAVRPITKVSGPPSKIKCINFGKYEIDTWHAAPYPEEYSRNRVLYICEFCLKYMSSDYVAWRHKLKCPTKHPPGDEIYRDGNFSFFEVDGRKNPVYCQNLCLLAKLFLGSKTLYYDVEPFLFYVMTEHDQFGEHFVGYFSKEKRPSSLNNVSCILVLPIHQRRGFGHMLIEFSYLLTKVEKKTGSPEKPLSDMGLVSYRSYWRLLLCRELLDQRATVSITDIAERTGMTPDDVVSALEGLRALIRDPVTRTYALRLDYAYFKQYIDNYEKKGYPRIDPDGLCWVPYVMGRDNMHYEGIPHIHTVAQRDDATDEVIAEEGVQMDAQAEAADNEALKDDNAAAGQNSGSQSSEQLLSPFPLLTTEAGAGATPTRQTVHNNVFANGTPASNTPIPPTRYEVFPPIPGTAAKRRPGRPFGRRGSHRGTPGRSAPSPGRLGQESPRSTTGTALIRRTRSMLTESMVNDASDDDDGEAPEDSQRGKDPSIDASGEALNSPEEEAQASALANPDNGESAMEED